MYYLFYFYSLQKDYTKVIDRGFVKFLKTGYEIWRERKNRIFSKRWSAGFKILKILERKKNLFYGSNVLKLL